MLPKAEKYRKRALSPLKFWVFKCIHLPSLVFWNIKLKSLDDEKCVVTIPFSHWTKNPFRSIYFSALNGAAELSTGLLCQMYIQDYGEISMLLVEFQGKYYKKATGITTFTCTDGQMIHENINKLKSGESTTFVAHSIGSNQNHDVVCEIWVTWSLLRKK